MSLNASSPIRVLFVCIHNSARSQIAEAFLKLLGGKQFDPQSAGLEPGALNPLAIDVMKEINIDISHNTTKSVFDLYKKGELFSYIITVCDSQASQRCPVFPGNAQKLHWSFPDPAAFCGSYQERLFQTRLVREAIRQKIQAWISEMKTRDTKGVLWNDTLTKN